MKTISSWGGGGGPGSTDKVTTFFLFSLQGSKCFSSGSMEAVQVFPRKPLATCDYPGGPDRIQGSRCSRVV